MFQQKYTIESIKEIVEQEYKNLNFKVISQTYPDLPGSKFMIKCIDCSTEYKMAVCHIKQSKGCHRCLKQYDIEDIKQLINVEYIHQNLTLLSEIYPDPEDGQFKLKCNICFHEFVRDVTNFKRSCGCPKCKHKSLGINRRFSLEDVKIIVKKYNYELVDDNYENANTPLKLKCAFGHITNKYLADLKRDQSISCTKCVDNKSGNGISEEVCRSFMEYLFDVSFDRCSPNWLTSPSSGGRMILDGYNDKLKIGFEYNGVIHYKFTKHFHRTYDYFMKRVIDDCEKRMVCYKNDIKLIIVPYTVKYKDMLNYIKDQCKFLNIQFPDKQNIEVSDLKLVNGKLTYYNKRIDEILENTIFKRISTYTNSKTDINVECKHCKCQRGILYQHIIKYNYDFCNKCYTKFDDLLDDSFEELSDDLFVESLNDFIKCRIYPEIESIDF